MENRYSTRDWSTKSFLLRAEYVSRVISGEMCTYFTENVFQMFGRPCRQKILRSRPKKRENHYIFMEKKNRLNGLQNTLIWNGTNNRPEPMKKYYPIICEYYQFYLSVYLSVICYVELSFPTCLNCLSRIVALQRE